MAATTRRTTRLPALPPITLGKLEETGNLLERLVATNQKLFIAKGQAFKDDHRDGSSRHLHPEEAAQIAAVLADGIDERVEIMEKVQTSTLRQYDEPEAREVLLASGLGTAPAFLAAAREVVALVEMPLDDFEDAYENDRLQADVAARARELRTLPLTEARARASAALDHYAKAAGASSGEGVRLLLSGVWQALQGAMTSLASARQPSSLIDSAAPTAASPAPTSSSDSPGGERPS